MTSPFHATIARQIANVLAVSTTFAALSEPVRRARIAYCATVQRALCVDVPVAATAATGRAYLDALIVALGAAYPEASELARGYSDTTAIASLPVSPADGSPSPVRTRRAKTAPATVPPSAPSPARVPDATDRAADLANALLGALRTPAETALPADLLDTLDAMTVRGTDDARMGALYDHALTFDPPTRVRPILRDFVSLATWAGHVRGILATMAAHPAPVAAPKVAPPVAPVVEPPPTPSAFHRAGAVLDYTRATEPVAIRLVSERTGVTHAFRFAPVKGPVRVARAYVSYLPADGGRPLYLGSLRVDGGIAHGGMRAAMSADAEPFRALTWAWAAFQGGRIPPALRVEAIAH